MNTGSPRMATGPQPRVSVMDAPPCPIWLTEVSQAWAAGWEASAKQHAQPRAEGMVLPRSVCRWHQQDEGYDTFTTSCGHEYTVNDCTDGSVELPFCPFCARSVQGIAWAASDDIPLEAALSAAPGEGSAAPRVEDDWNLQRAVPFDRTKPPPGAAPDTFGKATTHLPPANRRARDG